VIGAVSAACHGTTSPSCTDQEGRGSTAPTALEIKACAPDSTGIQCRAVATNRYDLYVYCPIDQDVTREATWISSDTNVGAFDAPGHLRVLSAGLVQVSAKYGFLQTAALPRWLFAVTPGAVPQQIVRWGVLVEDSLTRKNIQDALVQVQPSSGPMQTCRTNAIGACDFTIVAGTVQVAISKDGYLSTQVSLSATIDDSEQVVYLTPAT
jgi:hypothetical protein